MTTLQIPQTVRRCSFPALIQGMDWQQGEHVTLVGPTGIGKTTVGLALLPKRDYRAVFASKPRDPLISELAADYLVIREWPPPEPREAFPHVVLWPRINKVSQVKRQRNIFADALAACYLERGWCVYVDEGRYVFDYLRLGPLGELLWQQGRTQNISLVTGTQRPYWIPLSAYDQATHLFLWQDSDERNVQRLADMTPGLSKGELWDCFLGMGEHDFLYVNTRTKERYVSNVRWEG